MSIANDLSNHVDVIRQGLQTESLRTPDRTLAILDSRARFKTGVAGAGFSFTHLRNTPNVTFYRGADRHEASELDPVTEQVIISWANMMSDIQFTGTELEETLGMRADRLTDENYSLSQMGGDDRLVFLNYIMTRAISVAFRLQNARVQSLWGNDAGIEATTSDRLPASLPDIFNPETGLYGEPKTALGGFEVGHPWHGENRFGASEDLKMVPRVWNFNRTDGGTGAATSSSATNRNATNAANNELHRGLLTSAGEVDENAFRDLYECISQYSQVVPGEKVAICDNQTLTALGLIYRDADKMPILIGNDRWRYQVRAVQMEDIWFISDPFKDVNDHSIYVIHLGSGDDGSIFPFYWSPDMTMRGAIQEQMAARLYDPADGLTFGVQRQPSFYLDKFFRFTGLADAVGSSMRLKWMLVCTEPWKNLRINYIGRQDASGYARA